MIRKPKRKSRQEQKCKLRGLYKLRGRGDSGETEKIHRRATKKKMRGNRGEVFKGEIARMGRNLNGLGDRVSNQRTLGGYSEHIDRKARGRSQKE